MSEGFVFQQHMSRLGGQAALSEAILDFFLRNNIKASKAFANRLGVHVKRHIVSSLENEGAWGLTGLGTLRVR